VLTVNALPDTELLPLAFKEIYLSTEHSETVFNTWDNLVLTNFLTSALSFSNPGMSRCCPISRNATRTVTSLDPNKGKHWKNLLKLKGAFQAIWVFTTPPKPTRAAR
jgi:hypothetical protein